MCYEYMNNCLFICFIRMKLKEFLLLNHRVLGKNSIKNKIIILKPDDLMSTWSWTSYYKAARQPLPCFEKDRREKWKTLSKSLNLG